MPYSLGRIVPSDWKHVERYPYAAVSPGTVASVERALDLPAYREKYDQKSEGACVGFASSWMMSILNRRFYDARWLWSRAKEVDEWPETNPGDNNGTSVRAAMDVLRTTGHVRILRSVCKPPSLEEGIAENRWARTVDEVRTVIAAGVPVTLGVNWYSNFDVPQKVGGSYWIGLGNLGYIRGGHAVCVYRASDRMQAVGIVNNWGKEYPLVLMPYEVLGRLLQEYGEATMVTDR
ncbi:MAG: hypothetical protein QHH10_12970 [Peptococcaceae bacterium]|jgi:hypothetical protein|nr:hypothetical protein [Peptococcaceae bacterium]MDH7526210.1 hypothetical protein [Peptococcaceae bacterium]